MCGITGIYNIDNRKRIDIGLLYPMMNAIKHRGPDGQMAMSFGNAAFGFQRLSFIDLQGGMQPLQNENGTIAMVCNGEIFNYKEIREKLIAKGHMFKTQTDVEVIIHLYEQYGENFTELLNGQFAIALFDERNNKLLLVRDHMGIAPLFYTEIDGRIVFGSEIKAILEYPGVERKVNLTAIDQLLNFPGVVSPTTFFKNIYSLECGHMLRITPERGIENIEYWDVEYAVESEDKGEEYYIENLRQLLINAIGKRLIADVPIGFYISGGLDSSIVACFINEFITTHHSSFSAEIESADYSEKCYQDIIKKCIKSDHHSVSVSEVELWQYMSDVVYYTETALRESYDVAAFLLSGLVSSTSIKAVLTGQGADEFFNGYTGYVSDAFRMMQKNKMTKEECELNERLWGDPYFRYERRHNEINAFHKILYAQDLRTEIKNFSALKKSPVDLRKIEGLGTQRRRSYIDTKIRLADHLLGDHGDRMFFSHSVEGRHPFLDIDVVNFVINMPDKYKLRGANEKYILKKTAEGIIPDEILKRKKFPFSTPGMSYMLKRKDSLGELYLNDEIIKKQGIFEVNEVIRLKDQYIKDNFNVAGAYEIDYLQIIMTVTILCERFNLSI